MSKHKFELGDAVEVYQDLLSKPHHICHGTVTRFTDTMIVVINEHGNAMRFYKKDLKCVGAKDSLLRLTPKGDDPIQWDDGLEYYSGDEVAETLSVSDALYKRLYEAIALAANPTPQGGDGSNGTVETPDAQLGDYDDQIPAIWKYFTNEERQEINTAYRTHVNAVNELQPFAESIQEDDL